MADRAAVFIDGAYLTKILDVDFGKPKIDLAGFSDILCGNYERLRTYYYNCMPYQSCPPTEDERQVCLHGQVRLHTTKASQI